MKQSTLFALAALAIIAQADDDFHSRVRQSGICEDQTFFDDNEHPAGLLGAESLVEDGTIIATESVGLDMLPTQYGNALDLAMQHSNIERANYNAPGAFKGCGTHKGCVRTIIPAREVIVTSETTQNNEGRNDVNYKAKGERGQVYSLKGNLAR